MKYSMQVIAEKSEPKLGMEDEANQDHYFASESYCMVSDGLGGLNSGRKASHAAINLLKEKLERRYGGLKKKSPEEIETEISDLIKDTHAGIILKGKTDSALLDVGATLDLVMLVNDSIYVAHVGDSSVYTYSKANGLEKETEDETTVGELLREGMIDEEKAFVHPMKTELKNYLGVMKELKVNVKRITLGASPAEYILMATDGLTNLAKKS
ncbi:protein phosphatase 2C domain-containing protein, partial [Candidatus Woesearchaeota archaeon]|nr:protein phosphatase 2C domain-containing protein [Candidatus Woesearchaeota archaeon]